MSGGRGPGGHTLKLKCPSWDHVEQVVATKIGSDGRLSARLPFAPRVGETVTLAIELPDELVVAIEARVEEATPAPDGRRSAVRLDVFGLTAAVRARIAGLVRDGWGRGGGGAAPAPVGRRGRPSTRPPIAGEASGADPAAALPVPVPADAPIDEVVEPLPVPTLAAIGDAARAPAGELLATLERLRSAAAHDVLGVAWGASVAEIRAAYFALVLRVHPDRVARHGSPAVSLIAQEVFILVNKAYDRMRDAAVAAGEAIAAGPSLLPHRGWLAGFEDIGEVPSRHAEAAPAALSSPPAAPLDAAALFDDLDEDAAASSPAALAGTGADAGADAGAVAAGRPELDAARADLAAGRHLAARDRLVARVQAAPRDRAARALYHVAQAYLVAADGKPVEATSQLEAALAHDPSCAEAQAALEALRPEPGGRPGKGRLLGRLFPR